MPINIVICGTPCTGKSSLMDILKPKLEEFNFINTSKFAIDNNCTLGYDKEFDCYEIDEEKLKHVIGPILSSRKQSNIIESIHADVIPLDCVDWIFVCRAGNKELYDRLKARGYNECKLQNNMEAELFQVILDEAREIYENSDQITELLNNIPEDLVKNSEIILSKVRDLSKGPV